MTDPLIGHISDTCRSSLGRRHPFMYASILPISLSFFLLWNPLPGLSEQGLLLHLLCSLTATRVLIGFYEVPCSALVPEFVTDYDDRRKSAPT